jgi:hypothetical protein
VELLLALVILVIVVAIVSAPLRRRAGAGDGSDSAGAELAELEAEKRAKYRQIRDAEADRATGKLTDEDFRRLDTELRREAIAILKRMDRLRERAAADRDPAARGQGGGEGTVRPGGRLRDPDEHDLD